MVAGAAKSHCAICAAQSSWSHRLTSEREVKHRVNKQMGTVRFALEKSLRWCFVRLDTNSPPELTAIFSWASWREKIWNGSVVRQMQTFLRTREGSGGTTSLARNTVVCVRRGTESVHTVLSLLCLHTL